jgi:NitT/TauT family transport system ATP-binding protein
MAHPHVIVSNLHVRFTDGTSALQDVNLNVPHGQFVALVGPSGCGKSTMLRAIAGLQPPTSGSVETNDATTSFVFQDPTLLPWLTVCGNVELPLRIGGARHDDARRRAVAALGEVGLADSLDKLPRQLSGGMRMRVSVARSLVTQPSLFLFDEPFAAVDEIKREELIDMLLRIHGQRGFTALFVTHSVTEAVYLADRVIVLSARPGRIVADIPVELPRPRPHDLRFEHRFTDVCRTVSDALRGTGKG